MITLNPRKFYYTLFGGLIVMFAVTIKNSQEQFQGENEQIEFIMSKLGPLLFLAGWIFVAYAVGSDGNGTMLFNKKSILSVLSSTGVVISVMRMKSLMSNEEVVPYYLPGLFAVSWIILGFTTGIGRSNKNKIFGLLASALVIGSMLFVLPWQRKNNVIDGPGKDMFALAWVSLAAANSMVSS